MVLDQVLSPNERWSEQERESYRGGARKYLFYGQQVLEPPESVGLDVWMHRHVASVVTDYRHVQAAYTLLEDHVIKARCMGKVWHLHVYEPTQVPEEEDPTLVTFWDDEGTFLERLGA